MRTATIAAFVLLALPGIALAHAHLNSSVPAKGSQLAASPEKVTLNFSEAVALTSLTVKKAGEKEARPLGPLPAQDSVQLSVPLPKLEPGDYTIEWAAESLDQHTMKGKISFTVSRSQK